MFDEDYEDMDDLPLSDHIEWQYFNAEEDDLNELDEDEKEWVYG
ncbi:MAG: hypothetical protein ACU85E_17510 [Gammaproteobacteria bacterium]